MREREREPVDLDPVAALDQPPSFLGILVGIAQNLGIYFLGQKAGVSGAPELSVFVLLLVVLLARPQGLFGKETA